MCRSKEKKIKATLISFETVTEFYLCVKKNQTFFQKSENITS